MALVRADYHRRAADIKGYKWRTDDIAKLDPYFELHDVSRGVGIGILMAEDSGHSTKMGVDLIARSIRATTRMSEQNFHAAARLMRRACFWYLLDNPDVYETLRVRKKYRMEPEEIIWVDPERWVIYARDKVYKPGSDPEGWKDTVLRQVKKGGKT